jgi:hypothetical protein
MFDKFAVFKPEAKSEQVKEVFMQRRDHAILQKPSTLIDLQQ